MELSNQELHQPATLCISDVANEVPEELKVIMRENSRNLEQMAALKDDGKPVVYTVRAI